MSEFSPKELAELLGHVDHEDYHKDYKMRFVRFFGDNIDKYELFDEYKKICDDQNTKNHLECYNQIRLIIFQKCLDEVKYSINDAIENMEMWADEQYKQFVDIIVKNLFIRYDDYSIDEKDYDSIIRSYLTYKGEKNITVEQFKASQEIRNEITNKNTQQRLSLLMTFIEFACMASPQWEKEFTPDQIKLINMYRTYFLYKSPIVDLTDENSNLQFNIIMEYACDYSPEFYNIIFQLYLMGNNKNINSNTIKTAILDYDDPKGTYENLILKLWEWAQKEKGKSPIPSQGLKSFCCNVLQVVCDNNSYVRYNSQDFKNINAGWKTFQKANENILRKRRSLNND